MVLDGFRNNRLNGVSIEVEGGKLLSATANRVGVELDVNPIGEGDRALGYDVVASHRAFSDNIVGEIDFWVYSNGIRNIPGERIHVPHIKVPTEFRGRGIGTILFNTYKKYAVEGGFSRTSMRVGNGGTKEFLEKMGVEERFLHKNKFPKAKSESVVLTTESELRRIEGILGIGSTAEEMEGVFIEDAFADMR